MTMLSDEIAERLGNVRDLLDRASRLEVLLAEAVDVAHELELFMSADAGTPADDVIRRRLEPLPDVVDDPDPAVDVVDDVDPDLVVFRCPHCGKVCVNGAGLASHMRSCSTAPATVQRGRVLRCDDCDDFTTGSFTDLCAHTLAVHQRRPHAAERMPTVAP